MSSTMRFGLYMLVAIVIVALDQWTKFLASSQLTYGMPVEVLPVFNLTLQHNAGAAFSFLSDAGGWQRWFFSAISLIVSIVLVVWIYRLQSHQRLLVISLTLILGGAIGNLWDRVLLGYVVDFIQLHYEQHRFPTFNIADSAITLGAILMILDMFVNAENHR